MVYAPSGKFMMGREKHYWEKPAHEQVIEQGFWLDLTPVTNAAYAKFVAEGGYQRRDLWTGARRRGGSWWDYTGFLCCAYCSVCGI
jgi:iron(II)-dependent oxidoreductase